MEYRNFLEIMPTKKYGPKGPIIPKINEKKYTTLPENEKIIVISFFASFKQRVETGVLSIDDYSKWRNGLAYFPEQFVINQAEYLQWITELDPDLLLSVVKEIHKLKLIQQIGMEAYLENIQSEKVNPLHPENILDQILELVSLSTKSVYTELEERVASDGLCLLRKQLLEMRESSESANVVREGIIKKFHEQISYLETVPLLQPFVTEAEKLLVENIQKYSSTALQQLERKERPFEKNIIPLPLLEVVQ